MKLLVAVLCVELAVVSQSLPSGGRLLRVQEQAIHEAAHVLLEMKVGLQKHALEDREVFGALDSWCRDSSADKLKALSVGQLRAESLKGSLGHLEEQSKRRHEALASARQQLQDTQEDSASLVALLRHQAETFLDEERELRQAIGACQQAVTAFSRPHLDLPESRAAIRSLEALETTGLFADASPRPLSATLSVLLQETSGASSNRGGFRGSSQLQSHTLDSKPFLRTLEDLRARFESQLSALQLEEQQSQQEHKLAMAARQVEVDRLWKQVDELEKDETSSRHKAERTAEEIEDIRGQLETDQTFLTNLEQLCGETSRGYEARASRRSREVAAVEAADGVLRSLLEPLAPAVEEVLPSTVEVSVESLAPDSLADGRHIARVLTQALGHLQQVYMPLRMDDEQRLWLPGLQPAASDSDALESAAVLARFGRYTNNPQGMEVIQLLKGAFGEAGTNAEVVMSEELEGSPTGSEEAIFTVQK